MTDRYIDLGITADAPTLLADGVDAIRSLAGDTAWAPSPIEEWLLSAVARIGVEIAILAGRIPAQTIFTFFGQTLVGELPLSATNATGSVTVTAVDTNGPYTVPAGAQIDIDGQTFTTDSDLTIANGATTGSVGVTAAIAGTAGNDLTGETVALIAPTLLFVDSVALDATTDGGTNAEDTDTYADRLARELPTLSPKPILIDDFADLARRNPLVGRALAIDNYDPGPPIVLAAEGHVTVAVHDLAGRTLASDVRAAIATDLASDSQRVLNLAVHVIDPTFTPVAVTFAAASYDGWDPSAVHADAITTLQAFLDPAAWGRPTLGPSTGWIDEQTLRRNDLMGALYGVPGVRHVTSLSLTRARTVTASASTNVLTSTAHGFANGDAVQFSDLAGGAPLAIETTYYVRDVTTNTFKLAFTPGGTVLDITSDLTAGYVFPLDHITDVALDTPAALPTAVAVIGTVT
jgi:hypothetical protein